MRLRVCEYIMGFDGDTVGYYGTVLINHMIWACLRIEYSENNWIIIIFPLKMCNLQRKTGTPHSWTNPYGRFESLELAIQMGQNQTPMPVPCFLVLIDIHQKKSMDIDPSPSPVPAGGLALPLAPAHRPGVPTGDY